MKYSGLNILLIVFFVFTFSQSYCQTDSTEVSKSGLRKNIFYGSFGNLLFYYFAVEGGYERLIWENQKLVFSTFWIRAGIGRNVANEAYNGGPYYVLTLGTMTGAKSSHFECFVGMTMMYDRNDYEHQYSHYEDDISHNENSDIYQEPIKSDFYYLRPAGSIGYRFQKPGSHFLFKTGIGYPESVYFSFAIALDFKDGH